MQTTYQERIRAKIAAGQTPEDLLTFAANLGNVGHVKEILKIDNGIGAIDARKALAEGGRNKARLQITTARNLIPWDLSDFAHYALHQDATPPNPDLYNRERGTELLRHANQRLEAIRASLDFGLDTNSPLTDLHPEVLPLTLTTN